MSVLLETSLGDLVIDLDAALSPPAAENFLHLCRSKAYSNTLFHHLLPGFLVQAGLREPCNAVRSAADSRSAWARVEGARGAAVFEPRRSEKALRRGDVCLACTGPESRRVAGAQWFVVLGAADSLDGRHALIGSVVEGMEQGGTMEKIEKELCDGDGRPLRDIRIRHVEVLDDPVEPLAGLAVPSRTPSPTPSLLLSARPAATLSRSPTPLPDENDETKRKADASAAALTLEMVGDIAHADVRPPENILFVCKLNPVTRSEDLRLIFGRFGEIRSCEVIRDRKSGDSLQYAFIEFDEQSQAEQAYFKMQNVLVDDRRIWVDFSQSVGKLHASWLAGRGGAGARAGSAAGGPSARTDSYRGRGNGGMVFDFDERAPPPPERRDRERSGYERRERERSPRREDGYERRDRDRGYERERERDDGRRGGGAYSRDREERHPPPPRREYDRGDRGGERRRDERGDYARRDRDRDGRR